MTAEPPVWRVVCAWCGAVTRDGDPDAPVTHGVCDTCAARLRDEITRMTSRLVSARRLTR